MRITYFHYLASDDSALSHVRGFASAAHQLGADVETCALQLGDEGAKPSAAGDKAGLLARALRRPIARYLHEPRELGRNLGYLLREARHLRARRPDVVLARSSRLTFSCALSVRRAGLPFVLEANAPAAEADLYHSQYRHLPLLPAAAERWLLTAADAVVVVSSPLRSYFVERYRIPVAKICVVPNGVDVARFRPDVPADALTPRRDDDAVVVGFVGSFQEFHGPDLLARMVQRVAQRRPQARFLLVGDGSGAEGVRRALSSLGERVLFTGRVPHERVPGLVNAFDVGVLPETAFYCSPLKVIEWMAAGRAVVAPGYDSVREVLRDGEEGILFAPRDEDALCASILRLIDDAELRQRLGRAARKRAEADLTWIENARRVLDVCRSVSLPGRAPTAVALARSDRA